MTTLEFMVSAHRAHDDSGFNKVLTARESGTGAYYFQAPEFGCGRDNATPDGAIREVLESHGYRVNRIRPVEYATLPDGGVGLPGVKWESVGTKEAPMYRAQVNGWHVAAWRREPGSWAYSTEGRTDGPGQRATLQPGALDREIMATGGAASVSVAKRAAVALALALPADAKPVRQLHGGRVQALWREEVPPGCRSAVVAYWLPASAPGSAEWKAKHGLDLFEPEAAREYELATDSAAEADAEAVAVPAEPVKPAEIEPGAFYRLPVILPRAGEPADDMPHAADSVWSDALPLSVVAEVNSRLFWHGQPNLDESEVNRIHAPWKAGADSPDGLAHMIIAERSAALPAGWTFPARRFSGLSAPAGHRLIVLTAGEPESPIGENPAGAVSVPGRYVADIMESATLADLRLCAEESGFAMGAELPGCGAIVALEYVAPDATAAWLALVDSKLAARGCGLLTSAEREAYPEAGLTDATAEAFCDYLFSTRGRESNARTSAALAYAPRTHVVTVYARARGCSAEMVAQHVAATKPDAYAMARDAGHILGARLPDGREVNRRAYRFNR